MTAIKSELKSALYKDSADPLPGINKKFDTIFCISTSYNSTYPKGIVSCSKDSFLVNQTLVFQIKFYDKNPAPRVAANRSAL
jgi:hypothetical protein